MPPIVAILLMWLLWACTAIVTLLSAVYLPVATRATTGSTAHFGIFPAGLFLIPLLVCCGLRFWVSRIRSFGWKLVPYCFALFFAFQAEMYGIFLVPEYLIVFQLLGAALFLLLLPLFVKLPGGGPPPLPGARP